MTPETARQEIQRELMAGESLLWTGIPRQGFQLRSSDAFTIPFSLMWGGFAFLWETMALMTNTPWFFKLWGIPFVLVGVYLIIGRFALDSAERERTAYGLTSTRAIIVSGLRSRTVKSLTLRAQSDISLTEKPDGSGTILFGSPSMYDDPRPADSVAGPSCSAGVRDDRRCENRLLHDSKCPGGRIIRKKTRSQPRRVISWPTDPEMLEFIRTNSLA